MELNLKSHISGDTYAIETKAHLGFSESPKEMVADPHCHHTAASRIAYRINPGLSYCAIYLYAILTNGRNIE